MAPSLARPGDTVAALDIGTNTVILLVVRFGELGDFHVLKDEARVVRLGEGLSRHRAFLPEAMERTFRALSDFASDVRSLGASRILAVGTAAFRNAWNAGEFVRRVKTELGFTIEVISGEREAELIRRAVLADFSGAPRPLLALDIGGGSTEFILNPAAGAADARSLPVGSVVLTERFLGADPPPPRELAELDAFLDGELKAIPWTEVKTLVATAGTATTLGALVQNLSFYDPTHVHGCRITADELQALLRRLESLPFAERARLPCLEPRRADVIIAGARILGATLRRWRLTEFTVSDRGLRYGVLRAFLAADGAPSGQKPLASPPSRV